MIRTLPELLTNFEQRIRALETANQPVQPAAAQVAPAGLNGQGPTDREMKDADPTVEKPCVQLSAASLKLLLAGNTLEFDELVVAPFDGETAIDVDLTAEWNVKLQERVRALEEWSFKAALAIQDRVKHTAGLHPVACPVCAIVREYRQLSRKPGLLDGECEKAAA